jgi:hypothetical protein
MFSVVRPLEAAPAIARIAQFLVRNRHDDCFTVANSVYQIERKALKRNLAMQLHQAPPALREETGASSS